jgi:two-component system, OmpR family, sensor histidine kinase BaeS
VKRFGLSPLGRRLAASFVLVAIITLGLSAALTLVVDNRNVNALVRTSRSDALSAVVSAAVTAYGANSSWSGADLQPVIALADSVGAAVELSTETGQVLLSSGNTELLNSKSAPQEAAPVVSGSQTVGEVRLAFSSGGLSPAERSLRSAVVRTVGIAAGLAVLVALVASVLMTRLVVRPLGRLSRAAQAIGAGVKGVRIGPGMGPGELSDLSAAFDAMAVSLDRAEELRRGMVADVAHELRTPVAVLQAETEALIDGVRPPGIEALSSLHDETLRLGRMVEDLQALASADAAGLSLQRHRVDLAEVAAQAAQALAERFHSAEVRLDLSLTPVTVWADPQRLSQVVTNLLANASKYTPAGGDVHLSVRAEGDLARLEVTDSGPGVSPDERDRVFERFYRGGAGLRTGGTGIGLAVVKQLVEAHRGEVSIEDGPRGGASFVVLLPAVPAS